MSWSSASKASSAAHSRDGKQRKQTFFFARKIHTLWSFLKSDLVPFAFCWAHLLSHLPLSICGLLHNSGTQFKRSQLLSKNRTKAPQYENKELHSVENNPGYHSSLKILCLCKKPSCQNTFARSCKEIFRRKQKTMVQTVWLNRDETVGLEPSIKLLFLNLLLLILKLHGSIRAFHTLCKGHKYQRTCADFIVQGSCARDTLDICAS